MKNGPVNIKIEISEPIAGSFRIFAQIDDKKITFLDFHFLCFKPIRKIIFFSMVEFTIDLLPKEN